MAFGITDGRVDWEPGPVEGVTADAVLNEIPGDQADRQDAETFLCEMLAGGDPVPSKTVFAEARANGISERTLRRTKTRLNVRSKLVGFGKQGKWHWWLPVSEGHVTENSATEAAKSPETATQEVATSGHPCDDRGCQEAAIPEVAISAKSPIKHTRDTRGGQLCGRGGDRCRPHELLSW